MAAGLGFKTFTTGEVLTAADVNGYLMQGILVFANAAARTSAITSPQEGQYSFLKDTNALEYYDGAAWVGAPVGDITAVNAGTGITGGGSSGAVTITNDMATTITASGDIVVGTGSGTYDNLPIGTTGQVLTADTTVSPYKVKWAAPAAGSTYCGVSVYDTANQTISNNTSTAATWNSEYFDTDGFHSTTTNTSRLTVPAGKDGYYLISFQSTWALNATGSRTCELKKNGSNLKFANEIAGDASYYVGNEITMVTNLVAGDYIELFVKQTSGGNLSFEKTTGGGVVHFSMQLLGA